MNTHRHSEVRMEGREDSERTDAIKATFLCIKE